MTSGVCVADTFDAEFVEMGELDRDAAEIVPHAAEDLLDLGGGFLRKGGAQIVAADAVLGQQRADLAHERAGEIRRALAVHALDRAKKPTTDAPSIESKKLKRALGHQSMIQRKLDPGRDPGRSPRPPPKSCATKT